MQTKIQLEPYSRIMRVGCDVSVSNIRLPGGVIQHRVCLTRDAVPVACGVVARNSKYSVAELELRVRRGLIGPTSDMYRALCELAKLAEDLYGAEPPAAVAAREVL